LLDSVIVLMLIRPTTRRISRGPQEARNSFVFKLMHATLR
jgi:hypothetical protein